MTSLSYTPEWVESAIKDGLREVPGAVAVCGLCAVVCIWAYVLGGTL